jgi:hypothetical protein
VLTAGALLCFAGAALVLWLVREREIEREPVEPEGAPELPVTDDVAISSGY